MRELEAELAAQPLREGPPDRDHVWLDTVAAAVVLGVSANRVRQLIEAERIPATRHGRRWWLRRDLVEQCQAARAFKRFAGTCSRT